MCDQSLRTYQGVVYPSQCDAMGHMTVQYYVAAFDQAMWNLVYTLGWRPEPDRESRGFADVRHLAHYHAELAAGVPYVIDSHPVRCGISSLVTMHRMFDLATRTLAAELEMTSVHFDLKLRASAPLSESFREKITQFIDERSIATLTEHDNGRHQR